MTTSQSPPQVLRAQSDKIARIIKAVERGENPVEDVGGRITAARGREAVKFAVAMDDKVLVVDMPWATIRIMSEAAIGAYILKQMRGGREDG